MAKKSEKTKQEKIPETENNIQEDKDLLKSQIELQRNFFRTGCSKNVNWRITQLKKLYSSIKKHESEIQKALHDDLGKSEYESYLTEIGFVLREISTARKNLKKWATPKKVSGDVITKPAKSKIFPEPYGTVLILAPWNYPFLLSFQPLVSAVASGNTVVLKCSESSTATNAIIEKIIQEVFTPEHVLFVQPNYIQTQILMHEQFDFIFFTGSPSNGKKIMECAAKFLTPVCLELGGKSPCIVDETSNPSLAAKRIIWGKLLNAGQTCVAPDYVLVHESVKDYFVKFLYDEIEVQYGENPLTNDRYPKIINSKHFSRLFSMVPDASVDTSTNKISPVILDLGVLGSDTAENHPTMKEEIFGPILPVISYKSIDDVIDYLYKKPSSLALYLFSKNKTTQQKVFGSLKFGGGCLNDVVFHFTAKNLPFGGIGNSGIGAYHGEYGFKTFSHYKPILFQQLNKEKKHRYDPKNLKLLKRILK